jgi:hypothetical protein
MKVVDERLVYPLLLSSFRPPCSGPCPGEPPTGRSDETTGEGDLNPLPFPAIPAIPAKKESFSTLKRLFFFFLYWIKEPPSRGQPLKSVFFPPLSLLSLFERETKRGAGGKILGN